MNTVNIPSDERVALKWRVNLICTVDTLVKATDELLDLFHINFIRCCGQTAYFNSKRLQVISELIMRNWKLNIIFLSFLVLIYNVSSNEWSEVYPLIHSKLGLIRGLRATDGNYSMYLGIPYATVNESNPFGLSIPYSKFNEVFEAHDDSAICPQVEEFNNTIVGTLDCLHINIYVPNSASFSNRLPVLVYIYGGANMIGFAGRYLYGPRFLVKKDIILVTFNYRLGPYGFMCLDTPDVPGNQGLKDQQLAFKWIKENIEAFGGDSNKITVCGSSSGGTSIDIHMIYSYTKLFNQVIMQSGNTLFPWSMPKPDASSHLKLSKHLGFTTRNTNEALSFLSTINSNVLIAATAELGLKFNPCVEKDFVNVEKLIYDHPVNIKNPYLKDIPILTGYNSHEALIAYANMPPEDFATLNLFNDDIGQHFNFDSEEINDVEECVRHFYMGDEEISSQVKEKIIELNSDFYFNYPVVRIIKKLIDSGVKTIYCYLFGYSGKRNFLKARFNVTAKGASHADELGYLFDISYKNKSLTPEDELIVDRFTTLWANFVKFGNPTPETTQLLPVEWPIVTKDSLNYLYIDTEFKVKKRNYHSRMAFWDLFYRLHEKKQVGYREDTDPFTCTAIPLRYKQDFNKYFMYP